MADRQGEDTLIPAMVSHDLVMLGPVTILTFRVTTVHSEWWVNLGSVPTPPEQASFPLGLSTGIPLLTLV